MEQQELMNKMAKAYELQELMKEERQKLRLHELQYKKLMDYIVSCDLKKIGEYEVSETEVQKKRYIISDKFRERWPELFNTLAKVTIKAAKEVLDEAEQKELKDMYGVDVVKKPVIVYYG